MAKQKYYVVWDGAEDGVYTSWEVCQEMVSGYSSAKYKSFKSEEEAEEAFEMGYEAYKELEKQRNAEKERIKEENERLKAEEARKKEEEESQEVESVQQQDNRQQAKPFTLPEGAISNAIAVDAACSGNPGKMEYRGVYLRTGKEIFHFGPVYGTNNIGEFLAIVHGLALLQKQGLSDMPIYSDSVNAQLWVRKRKCKTTLVRDERTELLYQLIARAEAWLESNTYRNPIIKWPTEQWGEIPADFGRK